MNTMARSLVLGLICVWQVTALVIKEEKKFEVKAMGKGTVEVKVGEVHTMVNILSLVEKDKDGMMVPANASINPHKDMDLKNRNFMLPMHAKYENGSDPEHYAFHMTNMIMLKEKNATLKVHVKVAKTNGTIHGVPSSEKFKLMPGSLIVGFTLESWPFCGMAKLVKCMKNGTEVMGKYLDLTVQVKMAKFMRKNMTWTSDIEHGKLMLDLAAASAIDSTAKPIANYPMVADDMVTIRFDKFTGSQKGVFKYAHLRVHSDQASGGDRVTYVGAVTMTASFLLYILDLLS